MVRWFPGSTAMILLLAGSIAAVSPVAMAPAPAATGDKAEAEVFFEDARRYLEKGDVNAAIIQLKNTLQKDPKNVEARRMLGEIYLRIGNGPSAEKELEAARRQGASDGKLSILIARAHLLQGKFRDALDELEDDVPDEMLHAETLLVRGQAQLGLGQLDRAFRSFAEAESQLPNDVRPTLGIAQGLIKQGRLEEAEAKVDAALAIDGNASRALVLKGELRRLARDLEGAVRSFDAAIEQNGNSLPARLGRAAALIDLNRDDQAQADLQVVFRRVPKHPLASYLSALILSKKKDFAGAQEALRQAGALLDNHMPSVFLRGAIDYALGHLEQAVDNLRRYIAAVPGNAKARKLLGAALMRKKDPQAAIDVLKPLLESDSADAQTLALLGSAYMRVGKYAEGTKLFEKAAQAAPDLASIRTQLALGHLAAGASDKAVGDLETAIDLDPDARQAPVLLTLVKLRKGEFDDALESAERLRELMPGNPLPDNLMGAAWLGKGDLAKARESFENALDTNPDYHPARMNLAQLDLRENRVEAATEQYEAILEKDASHVGAMLALADIAAREKREADMVSWLEKASEANPRAIVPQLRLIEHYRQARDFHKALAAARELNSKVPDNPRVLEALGRSEMAVGDELAAASTFRRLASVAPKSARAFSLLGRAQAASNDIVGARASYGKAIELEGVYVPAYVALTELESREGNTGKALKLAATLREKQPEGAVGDMLTGDVYMRARDYAKAVDFYEAAMKKKETGALAIRLFNAERQADGTDAALDRLQAWVDRNDDTAARHVLASGYINAGKYDAAIRESETLLRNDADNPVLLNNLAWLYDRTGDRRAIRTAEKALKQAPDSPAVMDTLGWILVRQGDYERGARLLEKAHAGAATQGDIAYHYAVALDKLGRKREAARVLERALGGVETFSQAEQARKLLKELGD